MTPQLAAEGLARDVVRVVQQARREADLAVTDRIDLVVSASPEVVAAATSFQDFVNGETLADIGELRALVPRGSPVRSATVSKCWSG